MGVGQSIYDIKQKLSTRLDVEKLMYNSKSKFLDPDFPPCPQTLSIPDNKLDDDIVWLRASQLSFGLPGMCVCMYVYVCVVVDIMITGTIIL